MSAVCRWSRNRAPAFVNAASCSMGMRTSWSCHSGTAAVPEWGNQDVRIPLEQDAAFTKAGARFLDQRQTALFIIR